ncbi:glycosyltransferase [Ectobacillus panaciterrae]|uniref:glycosyltransferase n=1 Tax=Ectobacillus panaciterrae TaxID=363872 RepID=UPI0004066385|nr:glycosyltransferase [Ectobacillus panaciterrae]
MISIIVCTKRERAMQNVFENYERQQYEEKELIIVLNYDRMNINNWKKEADKYKNVSVFQLPQQTTLGECYNFAIPKARYPYIAKFDDDDYYSPYYLSEAARGFEESGAAVVGKSTVFIYYIGRAFLTIFNEGKEFVHIRGEKELYKKYLPGATLVFKKDIYPAISFEHINVGEDTMFLEACLKQGLPAYSTSRYNYVYLRYPQTTHHTSTFQEYKLFERSKPLCQTRNFQGMITSPVDDIFNKGEM